MLQSISQPIHPFLPFPQSENRATIPPEENVQPALHKPDDSINMQRAIKRLVSNGYEVSRKSPHQLKVGSCNFYPDRGTITRDGAKRIEQKGIDHFITLLQECEAPTRSRPPFRNRVNKEAGLTIVLEADSLPF